MKEMFSTYIQDNNTRNAKLRLRQPYRRTNKGQKGLSYLGPSIWNKIDTECKSIANLINLQTFPRLIFLLNSSRKMQRFITNFENFSVFYPVPLCCLYGCFSLLRLCFYVGTTMKIRLSNGRPPPP